MQRHQKTTLYLHNVLEAKLLAAELGRTPLQLFGSLKNLARRLLEALRYLSPPEENFDPQAAGRLKIRLGSS